MTRLLPLALLALTGCTTAQSLATCPNAHRALVIAQAAVARVCPMEVR